MAVQKSKIETFQVSGSREDWLSKCEKALHNAGFKSVIVNKELSLLSAKISTLTLRDHDTKVYFTYAWSEHL